MTAKPPLSGLRVCDLTAYGSGPIATQILHDLGATVIKVERPPAGDPERETDPCQFQIWNRGKSSIVLDLQKSAEDREVLKTPIAGADIFVEGNRPIITKKLGLDFNSVKALQPKIIYVSINAYGSEGPYANDIGLNLQYQGVSGTFFLGTDSNGLPNVSVAVPYLNYAASCYAVIGIMAALHQPETLPARIETPIVAAGLSWAMVRMSDYIRKGGKRIRGADVFETADGKFLSMMVDHHVTDLDGLTAAIGRPDFFAGVDQHDRDARFAMVEPLRAVFKEKTRDEWMALLREHGVMAAPILDPFEVIADPHVQSMGLLHHEPALHCSLPIYGIPSRTVGTTAPLDAQGEAIRASGWAAVS